MCMRVYVLTCMVLMTGVLVPIYSHLQVYAYVCSYMHVAHGRCTILLHTLTLSLVCTCMHEFSHHAWCSWQVYWSASYNNIIYVCINVLTCMVLMTSVLVGFHTLILNILSFSCVFVCMFSPCMVLMAGVLVSLRSKGGYWRGAKIHGREW